VAQGNCFFRKFAPCQGLNPSGSLATVARSALDTANSAACFFFSPFIVEPANLLCVKAASHRLRKTLRRFALTRKFCQPADFLGLKKTGKEVRSMRTYLVRVFQPTEVGIEAENEEHALEKVAELYKALYRKDIRSWIEPLPEPEDTR
jgi:hypothetical protein